ncbi:MAG: hypothetical protein HY906_23080 [Deltaproteobacteria bacterium]|nr:hypothetical protein [Deltaproteobacteria bacterium]
MTRRRRGGARPRDQALESRLRQWADITELCLGLRGASVVGTRQARSWQACVSAGLREANRERERRRHG